MSSTAIVGSYSDNILPIFWGAFQWNYPTYWLIAGSWLAWSYHNESQNRQFETTQLALKTAQLEQQLIESQMLNLKAQLQPHFLFNALNTISAFVEKDPRGARRMIEHLGDLLSYSLEHSEDQENSLAQELEVLNHYLAIQRVRFEDRLQVKMEIDSEALQAVVPTLILQPLVENAVHHGAVLQSKLVCVTIAASFNSGWLNLQVRDDGAGLHRNWSFVDDAGVGLGNTQKRLNRLYPNAHRFVVTNAPEGGAIAEISMPFRSITTIDSVNKGGANGKASHINR